LSDARADFEGATHAAILSAVPYLGEWRQYWSNAEVKEAFGFVLPEWQEGADFLVSGRILGGLR
jgi:hypothetical protein